VAKQRHATEEIIHKLRAADRWRGRGRYHQDDAVNVMGFTIELVVIAISVVVAQKSSKPVRNAPLTLCPRNAGNYNLSTTVYVAREQQLQHCGLKTLLHRATLVEPPFLRRAPGARAGQYKKPVFVQSAEVNRYVQKALTRSPVRFH